MFGKALFELALFAGRFGDRVLVCGFGPRLSHNILLVEQNFEILGNYKKPLLPVFQILGLPNIFAVILSYNFFLYIRKKILQLKNIKAEMTKQTKKAGS